MPPPQIRLEEFSNEELAIALLNPALRYHPQTLRLGAAMLSADGNSPEKIARLAEMERCQAVVRYIAEAGKNFEPQNSFWAALLAPLPVATAVKSGVVPHPTRFVAMTGITRGSIKTKWNGFARSHLAELRDAFERAKPLVRELARKGTITG